MLIREEDMFSGADIAPLSPQDYIVLVCEAAYLHLTSPIIALFNLVSLYDRVVAISFRAIMRTQEL